MGPAWLALLVAAFGTAHGKPPSLRRAAKAPAGLGLMTGLPVSDERGDDAAGEEKKGPESTVAKPKGPFEIQIRMPGAEPDEDDDYLCVAAKVEAASAVVTGFRAHIEAGHAHHMLLFGCREPGTGGGVGAVQEGKLYRCREMGVCMGDSRVLWGARRDEDSFQLPEGLGFRVGAETDSPYLVLQVHYQEPLSIGATPDRSGIDVDVVEEPQGADQPKSRPARMLMMYRGDFAIPPGRKAHRVGMECCYDGDPWLRGFSYRVHTHSLGRNNTLYVSPGQDSGDRAGGNSLVERVLWRDPREPQIFVNMDNPSELTDAGRSAGAHPASDVMIAPGESLSGFCEYDSTSRDAATAVGFAAKDEMCNFYLMVEETFRGAAAEAESRPLDAVEKGLVGDYICDGKILWYPGAASQHPYAYRKAGFARGLPAHLYADSLWLVREHRKAKGGSADFGQISGIDVAEDGDVWLFARRGRALADGVPTEGHDSTIPEPTIFKMCPRTGAVDRAFGANIFRMPHGLNWNRKQDRLWVTDIGLHQVMALSPRDGAVLLVLGTAGERGDDGEHFCKPTDALAIGDSLFVADGYCNDRVVRFALSEEDGGKVTAEYSADLVAPPGVPPMNTPHSLSRDPCGQLIVAARENYRVYMFRSDGSFVREVEIGERRPVYAAQYVPGGSLMVGTTHFKNRDRGSVEHAAVEGGVINSVSDATEDEGRMLAAPHDIAVGQDGTVYVAEIFAGRMPRTDPDRPRGRLLVYAFDDKFDEVAGSGDGDGIAKSAADAPPKTDEEGTSELDSLSGIPSSVPSDKDDDILRRIRERRRRSSHPRKASGSTSAVPVERDDSPLSAVVHRDLERLEGLEERRKKEIAHEESSNGGQGRGGVGRWWIVIGIAAIAVVGFLLGTVCAPGSSRRYSSYTQVSTDFSAFEEGGEAIERANSRRLKAMASSY